MKPERWQQIDKLLETALELDQSKWAAFLEEACGGDEELRREVESWLAAYRKADSFLSLPVLEVAAHLVPDDQVKSLVGQKLGPYKILSLLGTGGMGEVYRARDSRLERDVAIKVLPEHLSENLDALSRFKREAKAVAVLSHPNILAIHDFGMDQGVCYAVMELLEGETLRSCLERSALLWRRAVEIGVAIAEGLSAAHDKGIIHRDLKPENIFLTRDGQVKILDFGLARIKMVVSSREQTSMPTISYLTEPGTVMGTAGYMSPEQVRGEVADAPSDIFSFGCILYEMITGHHAFAGKTAADTTASILKDDPPKLADSKEIPRELERVIRHCLEKDPAGRFQSARDLAFDLRAMLEMEAQPSDKPAAAQVEPLSVSATQVQITPASYSEARAGLRLSGSKLSFVVISAAVAFGVIAIAFTVWQTQIKRSPTEMTGVLRYTQITSWSGLDIYPALSPDGNSIAYSSDHNGNFEIYVKQLTPGGREIQITSDGEQNFQPAWSPDGKLIAYYSRNRGSIWLVPALGGIAKQLTEFGSRPAWSPDGSFIALQSDPLTDLGAAAFGAMPPSTIWIVSSQGGTPRQITQVGNPPGGHSSPSWSPDGKRIVFVTNDVRLSEIWSISVMGEELKLLTRRARSRGFEILFDPIYSPDGENIYYAVGSGYSRALLKLHVSPSNGEPAGEPVVIMDTGPVLFRHLRVSADGKEIAYSALSVISNLWSVPISPSSDEATGPPVPLTRDTIYRKLFPAFSPEGRKIAFGAIRLGTPQNIWLMDADGCNPTQLTTGPASNSQPSWFPEGDQIMFLSDRQGHDMLWSTNLKNGRDKPLLDVGQDMGYALMSPDGKQVAFNSRKSGTVNIWTAPIEGGQPKQLTFDKELMGWPCWSPDGKYLAFEMKRGDDTHIAAMPSSGGTPTQLTSDRGQSWPHSWSPDGDKIAFAGFRNGYWNIWWVSRATKEQKQLTNYTKPNSYVRYPAWSPLGDKIVYEYAETTGNIWLMELK